MAESVDQKRLWRAEDDISELRDGQARIETRLDLFESNTGKSLESIVLKLDNISEAQREDRLELHDIKKNAESAQAWKKWSLTIISGAAAIAVKELAAIILRHL